MFRGISPLSLDSKGRLSIPAKYRERLQALCNGQLVVTIDRDRCLLIYPLPVWEEIERKLVELSSVDRRARGLKRLLLGHAEDYVLDTSNRILLSQPLREFAGLDKKVVLVGLGNKFELWDEQAWYRLRDEWLVQEDDADDDPPADWGSLSF